jgi:hypothetical protein
MLRDHTVTQESRTDDDLIIGRLQRQLMATKTAYKVEILNSHSYPNQAFTRKYQTLRTNMRQRELSQRILEQRLDSREETLLKMQESHGVEISALKKALKDIYESLVIGGGMDKENLSVGGPKVKKSDMDVRLSRPLPIQSLEEQTLKSIMHRLTGIGTLSSAQITITDKLAKLSQQITQLTTLAEQSNELVEISENKNMKLDIENEKMKEENSILMKSIKDINEILETNNLIGTGTGTNAVNSKKQLQQHTRAVALKVLNLGDEIKNLKLTNIQQKREIAILQQEKKHLKAVLTRVENDLQALEESKLQYQPQVRIFFSFS